MPSGTHRPQPETAIAGLAAALRMDVDLLVSHAAKFCLREPLNTTHFLGAVL